MRHFFASAIAETDVEQGSTATAAGTASGTAGTTGIASAQPAEPPLIELEPTATVAPPTTSAHVCEPVDVIDVDVPVWILRSTAEPTATIQSVSYISHSSVMPRSALSAAQATGTPLIAHATATLPMQSQYLHLPPPTQTVVVADIHPPPAAFTHTPASRTTPVPASFPLVELLPPGTYTRG